MHASLSALLFLNTLFQSFLSVFFFRVCFLLLMFQIRLFSNACMMQSAAMREQSARVWTELMDVQVAHYCNVALRTCIMSARFLRLLNRRCPAYMVNFHGNAQNA